jgi:hypothetical protein
VPIDPADGIVAFRAQLNAGDIAQPHGGAVWLGLENDLLELLRGLEARLRGHGGVEHLLPGLREAADFASRGHHDAQTVVVHLHPDGTGNLHLGPGLPDEVIRHLGCDGRVKTVEHDRHGVAVSVGRALRIVPELKGKPLGDASFTPSAPGLHAEIASPKPSVTGEAVSALLGLGVAEVNARRAVDQALIRLGDEADLSAVIRAALQELGR